MPPENEEQQQEQTTPAPGPATREDLIAAVLAAGGTEGAPAADAAPAAATPPAAEPATEGPLDIVLRARVKAHAEREAARASATTIEEQARAQAQRILDKAQADAQRMTEDAVTARKARFAGNPIEALREIGDPQEVVDAVLRAKSPEAQAIARAEAAERAAAKAEQVGAGAAKDFADFKAQQEQERQTAAATSYRQMFLDTHATETLTPHLHARFDPQEIAMRAVQQAQAWVGDGLRYRMQGQPKLSENDFDDADVAAYLERQSKEKLSRLIPTAPAAQQVSAAAPATEPGNAPKVQANGPRTLSAAQGSERRTSPKPLHQLPPDQRRQALIDEVNAAMRANPKAEY